jgi:hypothetical protein
MEFWWPYRVKNDLTAIAAKRYEYWMKAFGERRSYYSLIFSRTRRTTPRRYKSHQTLSEIFT